MWDREPIVSRNPGIPADGACEDDRPWSSSFAYQRSFLPRLGFAQANVGKKERFSWGETITSPKVG
jgi:hypothetical protein